MLEAKRLLSKGIDPSQHKQEVKQQQQLNVENNFAAIAQEWWQHQKRTWTEEHANRVWARIRDDVLPTLGNKPIAEILPQTIIAVIRRIESRGALDIASRQLQNIRRIFRYAVQTGRLAQNPASDLTGILKTRRTGSTPLTRTLSSRLVWSHRSVHVQAQTI